MLKFVLSRLLDGWIQADSLDEEDLDIESGSISVQDLQLIPQGFVGEGSQVASIQLQAVGGALWSAIMAQQPLKLIISGVQLVVGSGVSTYHGQFASAEVEGNESVELLGSLFERIKSLVTVELVNLEVNFGPFVAFVQLASINSALKLTISNGLSVSLAEQTLISCEGDIAASVDLSKKTISITLDQCTATLDQDKTSLLLEWVYGRQKQSAMASSASMYHSALSNFQTDSQASWKFNLTIDSVKLQALRVPCSNDSQPLNFDRVEILLSQTSCELSAGDMCSLNILIGDLILYEHLQGQRRTLLQFWRGRVPDDRSIFTSFVKSDVGLQSLLPSKLQSLNFSSQRKISDSAISGTSSISISYKQDELLKFSLASVLHADLDLNMYHRYHDYISAFNISETKNSASRSFIDWAIDAMSIRISFQDPVALSNVCVVVVDQFQAQEKRLSFKHLELKLGGQALIASFDGTNTCQMSQASDQSQKQISLNDLTFAAQSSDQVRNQLHSLLQRTEHIRLDIESIWLNISSDLVDQVAQLFENIVGFTTNAISQYKLQSSTLQLYLSVKKLVLAVQISNSLSCTVKLNDLQYMQTTLLNFFSSRSCKIVDMDNNCLMESLSTCDLAFLMPQQSSSFEITIEGFNVHRQEIVPIAAAVFVAVRLRDSKKKNDIGLARIPDTLILQIYMKDISVLSRLQKGMYVANIGALQLKYSNQTIEAKLISPAHLLGLDIMESSTDDYTQKSASLENWEQRKFKILAEVSSAASKVVFAQSLDINIDCVSLLITTCQDSTQFLQLVVADILSLLNRPVVSSSQEADTSIDLMKDIDQDTFKPTVRRDIIVDHSSESPDLLDDLLFVPDYYKPAEQSQPQDDLEFIKHHEYSPTALFGDSALQGDQVRPLVFASDNSVEDFVHVLDEDVPMQFVHDHYLPKDNQQTINRSTKLKISLTNANVVWKLLAGYDWQYNIDIAESELQKKPRSRLNSQSSVLEPAIEIVFNEQSDSYIEKFEHESPSQPDLSADQNESSTTSKSNYIRNDINSVLFTLSSLQLVFQVFSDVDNSKVASEGTITVGDFEITDMVQSSRWRKFLTLMKPDQQHRFERQTGTSMVSVKLFGMQYEDQVEYRVSADILPLRMYVDQDTLRYLSNYFSFGGQPSQQTSKENSLYFQFVNVSATAVTLDYKPKTMNYRQISAGNYIELLNMFSLENVSLLLPSVQLRAISGISRLIQSILENWIGTVVESQLPSVALAMLPVRSFVDMGNRMVDMILLPVEEYRKRNGNVLNAVKQGTFRFVETAALETLKLGGKIAAGTQNLFENIDSIISDAPDSSLYQRQNLSKMADQPRNASQGLQQATETLLAIPQSMSGSGGASVSVLKPAIGVSEAIRKALLGLRNQIDPQNLKQIRDKYKSSMHNY